jgi:hypothetical protein
MNSRSRMFWRVGAVIFTVANVAGAIYAAVMGESTHAIAHVVVFVLGVVAYRVWGPQGPQPELEVAGLAQASRSIDHLQQAVDAIALDVERISEGQRFEARLLEERGLNVPQQKKEQ